MDRRLMGLIFLFVTSSNLGSVNGSECNDDDDCMESDEHICCEGNCHEFCYDTFFVILFFIVIPIVVCVLCLGAIALIVFCVVGASTAAAVTMSSAGTSEAPGQPPNVSYSAYPPYTSTNYGYQPPSYTPQPTYPPLGK